MELFSRSPNNPILSPEAASWWQSRAVFNPAAAERDGTIYLLYRAVGPDPHYVSRLGLAGSKDGETFSRLSAAAVLEPAEEYDRWGVEDPRATSLEGRIYLTYTAVSQPVMEDGRPILDRDQPLTTRSGLAVTDDLFSIDRLGLITPPLADSKNAVLFPEKINGRYALLHRPRRWSQEWLRRHGWEHRTEVPSEVEYLPENPGIWLSYSPDLRDWSDHQLVLESSRPDDERIGAGPPPLLTSDGWLLIYHRVHKEAAGQRVYSAQAALLDLEQPSKVRGWKKEPILSPRAPYELTGDVPRVVFPTGLIRRGDTLYLYYGAADTHCAVATASLQALLEVLKGGTS